jgi:hypothetical protein
MYVKAKGLRSLVGMPMAKAFECEAEPVEVNEKGGSSTKVTTHMEMKAGGFMTVAEPLVSSGLRRGLQKNFGDLKDLLESGVLSVEQEAAKA